ncbi:MAG: AAA family ATPase [Anaerolineae bacterium]|nr:AAA family ATPase [Anaerolineae bacterium]
MRLTNLKATGFRSLQRIDLDFSPLTVLIGENDSGKSSVLDLISMCLSGGRPDSSDFYQDENGKTVDAAEAELAFQLDEDGDDNARPFALSDCLRVQFTFSRTPPTRECCYWGEVPQDNRLDQDFAKLSVQDQKDLIATLNPTVPQADISNAEKRLTWLAEYKASALKVQKWVPTQGKWGEFLPRFERYNTLDYNAPENLISGTLKQVYEQTIYEEVDHEDGTKTRQWIEPLRKVETQAHQRLRDEVSKLEAYIRKYNKQVCDIGYEPKFDFTASLKTGELAVDTTGRGLRMLSKTGAGTRRRMYMGILDWDRDVTRREAKAAAGLPSIIRGYDEPDTNLHYEAQRFMYQVISDIVSAPHSRVQAILCTHSLTMIDRAPAQSIRLFRMCGEGCTEVSFLETDGDPEIESFLSNIAHELGITNSLIFYERCYVLIEGPTEENALPILYRKAFGRSLLEDGIRIVNVSGNGAFKEFLKLWSRNRQELTIVLADSDTQTQKAAKLTADVLREAGFSPTFIETHVRFIGSCEFEDVFIDELIARCLDGHWPKAAGNWQSSDIAAIRGQGKFSDAIGKAVWENRREPFAGWSKPEFGRKLAETCTCAEIPEPIADLFALMRQIADVS